MLLEWSSQCPDCDIIWNMYVDLKQTAYARLPKISETQEVFYKKEWENFLNKNKKSKLATKSIRSICQWECY